MKSNKSLNNKEVHLNDEEFIVSKTDLRGNLIYANRTFMQISQYSEDQILYKNHNIIRHPDMPKAVFNLLWKTLKSGKEFFGFVKNNCADGSYYWVLANITPQYDHNKDHIGYLSVRRKPPVSAIRTISDVYVQMKNLEAKAATPKEAIAKSTEFLEQHLRQLNTDYQSYVINLFHSK